MRVRVFVSSDHDVVDRDPTGLESAGLVVRSRATGAGARESTTETALGLATSTPEATPVAKRYLRLR